MLMNEDKNIFLVKGQSLVETGIFLIILLSVLGVLLNYGLQYNYQQRTRQQAFRRALGYASEHMGTASYQVVRDYHIPSPEDPFAMGSMTPIPGSASVVRDYSMHRVAWDYGNLLKTGFTIMDSYGDTSNIKKLLSLQVRNEYSIWDTGIIDKYKLLYGDTNVCTEGSCGATCTEDDGKIVNCALIRIRDPNLGELTDYSKMVAFCRKLVDVEVCKQSCEESEWPTKGGDDEDRPDCDTVCNVETNPPHQNDPGYDPGLGGAWYCANWELVDEGDPNTPNDNYYYFPIVEQLFSFAYDSVGLYKPKTMGLQPESEQTRKYNNRLEVEDTPSSTTTRNVYNWQVDTTRHYIYYDCNYNSRGECQNTSGNWQEGTINNKKSRNETTEWQTTK